MSADRKGYVGIYEFARQTGHSVKHIYEQIRLGKITAKKLGRKWQIPEGELKARMQP
jgi:excisionase family DNA binding protein